MFTRPVLILVFFVNVSMMSAEMLSENKRHLLWYGKGISITSCLMTSIPMFRGAAIFIAHKSSLHTNLGCFGFASSS